MTETIQFTSRIFGRYIEMHALVILHSLELAETMNSRLFTVCKAALSNAEESFCGVTRDAR